MFSVHLTPADPTRRICVCRCDQLHCPPLIQFRLHPDHGPGLTRQATAHGHSGKNDPFANVRPEP